eukprot:1157289-Pelagomonas_calceolata.AAC.5
MHHLAVPAQFPPGTGVVCLLASSCCFSQHAAYLCSCHPGLHSSPLDLINWKAAGKSWPGLCTRGHYGTVAAVANPAGGLALRKALHFASILYYNKSIY